jgi:prepilin-type N-terminal cleavage/methylation domain-containing protein
LRNLRPLQADRDRRDEGLTLIELLVAMFIFSIVLAVSYSVLITVQRQSRDISGREETVGQARIALQQMDRQIRSGNVLYNPNDTTDPGYLPLSMRVYTQANGDERCVQWQITNGLLRSRSWSPTWQTDGLVSGWGTVARGLQNPWPSTVQPFALQGSTTNYSSRLIDVTLLVKDARSKGNVQKVSSSLSGRNTLYGYDAGVCAPMPTP